MRVDIGRYTYEFNFSVKLRDSVLSEDILKEASGSTGKIPLIKAARRLQPELGLLEAKNLVERLFVFEGDIYS